MIHRILGALICLFSTGSVLAQCASYPYTLTNGTTADASQVMSNFSYILNCATTNIVGPAQGGTGVANNSAATLTRSGNHALTITTTGTTNVTLPTSGTLLTSTSLTLPTRQVLTSGTSATYTTPSGARQLRIRMKGGGASGGGAGTTASSPGASTAGSGTSFNSIVAAGGGAGGSGSSGEGGKSGSGTASLRIAGAPGQFQTTLATAADSYWLTGGTGGGVGGGKSALGSTGYSGVANTGGGGEGEYVELVIDSPAATYTYTVGASVSGGAAGTSGTAGGSGASGYIVVDEYY